MKTIPCLKSLAINSLISCIALTALVANAANITWTNAASGGWNTTSNWNPNSVPGPTDTAIITNAGVTVSLNGATTVGAIILGTNGAGTVTLALNSQTLSLNGPLTVNPSGSFTVDSALIGNTNAVLSGVIGWTVGSLGGVLTLAPGSTLNITTGNSHNLASLTFTNNGTVVWNNGTIQGGGTPPSLIINNGLWDAQSDWTWNNVYGGSGTIFNNVGTFRKSASTGGNTTFASGAIFNNTGKLDSQASYIVLSGGGNFTGGTATNLVGFVYLNVGAFTINGTVTSTNVQLAGAVLTGNNVISGGLNWIVGDWNSSTDTIATNSILLITSGNSHNVGNCTITNNGTVVWNNGTIQGGGTPGTLVVNNGVWDAQSDWTWNNAYAGNGTTFNNNGTFRKSAGAGGNTTFAGGAIFNNTGKLDSQTNYIVLSSGGNFTGGTATNLVGFVYLNGGAFTFNGTVTSTNVQLAGAVLTGTNVISGGFNWIVGDWNNSTSETIATNSLLLITSANNHNIQNCTITNNGTVAWNNGTIQAGGTPGTLIINNGLWDMQSDQTINNAYSGNGAVFNNRGTVRKSGGVGIGSTYTLFAGGVVFNQLAGVIDTQNGTNGLELVFQGGGNFTGGYITTNFNGVTVLSVGSFNLNGTVTGTNTFENNGNLVGTNVINGNLTWIGGVWNGAVVTVSSGSTVWVSGGGGVNDLSAAIVTNNGTIKWVSGQIRGGNGAVIINNGLWDAQSDQQMSNAYGGANSVFNNFGTFRKSGGVGIGSTYTLFAGSVVFNQLAGVIDTQNGTNGLELVFQGGGNFTGGYITTNVSGLNVFSIGSFNLNGTVTGTNTYENNGNLVGVNVIKGALTWVGGVWNGAVVTISTNSKVIVAGGAGLNDFNTAIVTNFGTVAWSSGQMRGGNGSVIYNYGLWDAQSDQQINAAYGGAATFNNLGTFQKSAASGSTVVASSLLFNQTSGVLSALRGNIVLQGGANFSGGTITNGTTATTYFSQGNFNIVGTTTSGNVVENAGIMVGNNVINGTFTWTAGNWNGAAVTTTTNSVVTINGGGVNDLNGGVVTNNGTVLWGNGQIRGGNGAVIVNNGLWDAQTDQQINAAYGGAMTFNNNGTFRKEFTSGVTSIANPITFNNTGKLDAQNGNIALQGGYTLANGTKMGFGLGGAAGNGSVSLSGAAAFAGSYSVNLNGFFWPAAGSTFNLLNYTSETGVLFTNTTTLPAVGALTWQTNYNATAFVLTTLAHTSTNLTSTNVFLSSVNPSNVIVQWPGDHTGWRVQTQTNTLAVGLSTNWVAIPGSSATNQLVLANVKTNGAVFFRMIYP